MFADEDQHPWPDHGSAQLDWLSILQMAAVYTATLTKAYLSAVID